MLNVKKKAENIKTQCLPSKIPRVS